MIVPELAGNVPASTARNVDLPAPFGPMRPVIRPGRTSIDTSSTARTPSKCLLTCCATSKGRWSGAGRPATGVSGSASVSTGTGIPHLRDLPAWREHATPLGQNATRSEPEETEDQAADAHPLERWDQAGRTERRQVAGRLLESHRDQQRAKHCAVVVAAPTDDHRGEQDQGLRV